MFSVLIASRIYNSDDVGEIVFSAPKDVERQYKHPQGNGRCQSDLRPVEDAAGEGGTESVKHDGNRINHEDPTPLFRHHAGRIDHRRRKHPDLNQEWKRMTQIAILYRQ